jgi:hypothetical protein
VPGVPGGRQTDFQHGSIVWTPELGAAPDVVLTGHGNADIPIHLGSAPMIATVHNEQAAGSTFSVVASDAAGVFPEELTYQSTAGRGEPTFDGVHSVNWRYQYNPGRLYSRVTVRSVGDWSVHIQPLTSAPVLRLGQTVTGSGSAVYRFSNELTRAKLSITGTADPANDRNWLYQADARGLITLTAGATNSLPYSQDTYIDRGYLFMASTTGRWTLEVAPRTLG